MDLSDVTLAKSQPAAARKRKPRKAANTKKQTKAKSSGSSGSGGPTAGSSNSKKLSSLSKLLSPNNMQETVKTVTNLRGMVKNWLGYLQQADKMLDTVFVTTSSLKESGVLDKLIKQRGKNLSTEDFTSILAALMSSPMASSFLGGGDEDEDTAQPETTQAQPEPQAPRQGLPPGQQRPPEPPRM